MFEGTMASTRIHSLDGIRAVSILLVVVDHMGGRAVLEMGSLGVRIFFIISGYLITSLLLDELSKTGRINLFRFYYRRTMRIFPAFYFYLGCVLFLAAIGWVTLSKWDAIIAISYTSNFFSNQLDPLVQHTWSLAAEEQFYLVWPLALMLAGRRHAILALFVLVVVAEVMAHFLSLVFHSRVPSFFNVQIVFGCLYALLQFSVQKNRLYRRWIGSYFGVFLPFLILAISFLVSGTKGIESRALGLLLNSTIVFALDWAIVNHENPECRWLNSRPMIYLGVLSYSMYLWQQPFTEASVVFPAGSDWLMNPVVQICAIAACTLFSFYVVERPILRWRGKLEPRLFHTGLPSK
jgi:peptidoglycan/LPS O-acetylase OafA/YrhL